MELTDAGRTFLESVVAMVKSIFITRSDIASYSRNANVQVRPRRLARETRLTLCVNANCRVPEDLALACERVVVYAHLSDIEREIDGSYGCVCTGFDFPCMWEGLRLKRRFGIPWTMYLWDPPSLGHRDRFPPLRGAIDFVWRWFARRCDRLVVNIHPGLLSEMGIGDRELEAWKLAGKLELRMQDAFDGLVPSPLSSPDSFERDIGILSDELPCKGSVLVAEALRRLSGVSVEWVHDLPQEEAFARLRRCRVLLVPYLPVRSLKWNYVLKLFEYLQQGRPILASDNPGNVAVAGRFPGWIRLFKSGSVDDLAEKLKEMLCL